MFNKLLNHLEEWLISFLMAAATLVIFVAVVHRYLAGLPYIQDIALKVHMSWAQELCIILFVWMCKFGAAYGVRTGIHVGVDVVINRMSPRNRGRFVIFGLLAGAFFTGIIAVMGGAFVWERRPLCLPAADRPDPRRRVRRAAHARPGMADLDRLLRHPAGLGADVLPLPAGLLELPQDRRAAQAR